MSAQIGGYLKSVWKKPWSRGVFTWETCLPRDVLRGSTIPAKLAGWSNSARLSTSETARRRVSSEKYIRRPGSHQHRYRPRTPGEPPHRRQAPRARLPQTGSDQPRGRRLPHGDGWRSELITKKGLTRQGAPDLQSGSARVRRYWPAEQIQIRWRGAGVNNDRGATVSVARRSCAARITDLTSNLRRPRTASICSASAGDQLTTEIAHIAVVWLTVVRAATRAVPLYRSGCGEKLLVELAGGGAG